MEGYMKLKNYEKKELLLLAIIGLFIVEIIFIASLMIKTCNIYDTYQGIVQKKNIIIVFIDDNQLKDFYKNHYIYVNNQKKKFKLRKVTRDVLTRKKVKYHEILIEFNFEKKLKENDVVDFSLQKEKIKLIEIFKVIWEG